MRKKYEQINYDKQGVYKINGKVITKLNDSRNDFWTYGRLFCAGCGKIIAVTSERKQEYTKKGSEIEFANTGILFAHIWLNKTTRTKKALGDISIEKKVVLLLDHPSFCKSCMKDLEKKGYEMCDCGCGG